MREFWGNSLAACSPITSLKLMLATLLQPCSWSLGLLLASREISLSHVVLHCIRNMEFCLPHLECGISCFGYTIPASNIKPRQITSLTVSTAGIQPIGVLKLSVEEYTSIYLWLKMFPMPYCGDFLFNLLLLILNTCSPKLSSVVLLHICSFSFVMLIMKLSTLSLLGVSVFLTLATAQLSGHPGPTTMRDADIAALRTALTMVSQNIVCSIHRSFEFKVLIPVKTGEIQISRFAVVVIIFLGVHSISLLFQQFLYHSSASQLSTLSLSGPNGFGL